MNRPALLVGILSIGFFLAPLAVGAQPALEQFQFDPPRLCPRDTVRFDFSYRGFPGGLAAVKNFVMEGVWEGPGERPFRSFYSPTREDLAPYTTDEGRFGSRRLHAGPPPRGTPREAQIRYTLRAVLADGREVMSVTSVRYVDTCPPPPLYTTLATGPTGRIGFRTTTPTISEFLQGVGPVATGVIWGDLELPAGQVARRPAVVLVHGSAGVSPREDRWADELRQARMATFVLDSFTGRAIESTTADQSQLSSLAMIGDAYRALELLATHPRTDPDRIAVMGFSKGGAVALYAALRRFQRLHGPAGARFAQHIAFYAPCYYTFVGDEEVTDRPIRLFHGTVDDLAPLRLCRAYVERLRQRGADAQLTAYAEAHHGFDWPSDAPVRHNSREQNASRCFWAEHPEGYLVNRDSGQPFSLDDPCVLRGGTSGPDPAAYRAALQAVRAFVGTEPGPSR